MNSVNARIKLELKRIENMKSSELPSNSLESLVSSEMEELRKNLDSKLVDIELKRMSRVDRNVNDTSELTKDKDSSIQSPEQVTQIVKEALTKYDADKTGNFSQFNAIQCTLFS